jgi:hypothetical protein
VQAWHATEKKQPFNVAEKRQQLIDKITEKIIERLQL